MDLRTLSRIPFETQTGRTYSLYMPFECPLVVESPAATWCIAEMSKNGMRIMFFLVLIPIALSFKASIAKGASKARLGRLAAMRHFSASGLMQQRGQSGRGGLKDLSGTRRSIRFENSF